MKIHRYLYFIAAVSGVIGSSIPAQAVSFNFTYDTGVTTQQKEAFEFAGRYWSEYLSDDATINLHIDFAANSKMSRQVNGVTQTALAGAIPYFLNPTVNDVWGGMMNDVNLSGDDITAINNNNYKTIGIGSATSPNPNGLLWTNFLSPYDVNHEAGFSSTTMSITRANAKAIGLLDKNNTSLDGVILVNSLDSLINGKQYGWYNSGYQRSASNSSTQFDLTTVAVHEIGHILGFVSSLEAATDSTSYWDMAYREQAITTFDLFRSSDRRATLGNAGADLAHGAQTYFSLDNGATSIGLLSTGVDVSDSYNTTIAGFKGDGYQGSHWKQDNSKTYKNPFNLSNVNRGLGVMAPALSTGHRREMSDLDLRVMDVIGWQRKNSTTSFATLESQAKTAAASKGNVNRNTEAANMYNQNRWGGSSSTTTLSQVNDLADHFKQLGVFQMGGFWSVLGEEEKDDPVSVPEPSAALGLLGLGLFGLRLGKQKTHTNLHQ
ncbi:PEP-CTERM sorting domain-containing protein [Tolypothrix sp. FACHB-123]|uniref:NF038122 family metalloprotease n=1 Tax=Tolypothrix sp. FACHB-123 TaxID=2692868 RepID=UPI001688FC7A|nr:NF038122 family metalloprotease [Tolypothrix sp. FACHB-123]MBD2354225.1 PEP-CTERM sorting domain-containing protein [Tolypothrix sp. FACHB-123]